MNEVIDHAGKTIAVAPRSEVKEKKLRHKTAFIIVENTKGELFVAQRSPNKKTYPLKWALGAGGAVTAGESYDAAAKRELKEELGIEGNLKYLFDFPFESEQIKYIAKVYLIKSDAQVTMDTTEYIQSKWLTKEEMMIIGKKGEMCPDTFEYFKIYLKQNK